MRQNRHHTAADLTCESEPRRLSGPLIIIEPIHCQDVPPALLALAVNRFRLGGISRSRASFRSVVPQSLPAKSPGYLTDILPRRQARANRQILRPPHRVPYQRETIRIMIDKVECVGSLDELRAFVHKTLCERENILQDQFGLTVTTLLRNGAACGLQFSLQGPRSVRLEAIWVADRNILYCYDARGQRFLKVQLPQRLSLCAA